MSGTKKKGIVKSEKKVTKSAIQGSVNHLQKFTSRKFLLTVMGVALFFLKSLDVNVPDEVLYPILAYILGEAGVDIARILKQE